MACPPSASFPGECRDVWGTGRDGDRAPEHHGGHPGQAKSDQCKPRRNKPTEQLGKTTDVVCPYDPPCAGDSREMAALN